MSDYHQVVFSHKLTKKFITLFRELRCLWDREDRDYRIKNKKHEALTRLTELVQQHEPSATRVHVLRKLESLRACVRREYKKVQNSRQYATCEDDIHKPNLWYYNMLMFLFDENNKPTPEAKVSKTESGDEEIDNDDDDDDDDNYEPVDDEPQDSFEENYQSDFNIMNVEVDRPSTSSVKHSRTYDEGIKSKRAKISSAEVDDEYDAIGINVAAKLRNLPANMRIVAEKLINDVLFQAQINGLNSSTKIVTSDPFKNESACSSNTS